MICHSLLFRRWYNFFSCSSSWCYWLFFSKSNYLIHCLLIIIVLYKNMITLSKFNWILVINMPWNKYNIFSCVWGYSYLLNYISLICYLFTYNLHLITSLQIYFKYHTLHCLLSVLWNCSYHNYLSGWLLYIRISWF